MDEPSMNLSLHCTPAVLEDLKISESWYQVLGQLVSTLVCFSTIPATVLAFFAIRRGRVPGTLKVILCFHHFAALSYSISYVLTQSYHLITRAIYEGCDLLVPVRYCVIARMFQSVPSAFFQLFYIAVVLNTLFGRFKFWNNFWAGGLAFGALAGSFIGTFPSYPVDSMSEEYMINCSSFEHKTVPVQIKIFSFFIGIDLASAIVFQCLQLYQNREMKNPVLKYNVSKRLQSMEIKKVSRLIRTNLMVNVGSYMYFGVASLFQANEEKLNGNRFIWVNSVPYYLSFSTTSWYLKLRTKKAKILPQISETEQYFTQLAAYWGDNSKHVSKKKRRSDFQRRFRKESLTPSMSYVVDPSLIQVSTVC